MCINIKIGNILSEKEGMMSYENVYQKPTFWSACKTYNLRDTGNFLSNIDFLGANVVHYLDLVVHP